MSLVIPEWSNVSRISDTATVIFAGPCIIKGIFGDLDGAGATLKFYDGISGTASNSLKFSVLSSGDASMDMFNTAFTTGLAYDATGSTTGVHVHIAWVPTGGWYRP